MKCLIVQTPNNINLLPKKTSGHFLKHLGFFLETAETQTEVEKCAKRMVASHLRACFSHYPSSWPDEVKLASDSHVYTGK